MPLQPVFIKTTNTQLGVPWVRCIRLDVPAGWLDGTDNALGTYNDVSNNPYGTAHFNEFRVVNGVVETYSINTLPYAIKYDPSGNNYAGRVSLGYGTGTSYMVLGGSATGELAGASWSQKFTRLGGQLTDTQYLEYDNTIDLQNGNTDDLKAQIEAAIAGGAGEEDANKQTAINLRAAAGGQAVLSMNGGNQLGLPWIKQIMFVGLDLTNTAESLGSTELSWDDTNGVAQAFEIKIKGTDNLYQVFSFASIALNTTLHKITVGYGGAVFELPGDATVSAATTWGARLRALAQVQNQDPTTLGWTYTNSLYPLTEDSNDKLDTLNEKKKIYIESLVAGNAGTMRLTDIDGNGNTPNDWSPWIRGGYITFTGIDPSVSPGTPLPPSGNALGAGQNVTGAGNIVISSNGTQGAEQSFNFRLFKGDGTALKIQYGNVPMTVGDAANNIDSYGSWALALQAVAANSSGGMEYNLIGGGGGVDPAVVAAALAEVKVARTAYNLATAADKLLSDGLTQAKINWLNAISVDGTTTVDLAGQGIERPHASATNSVELKANAQWRHNVLNQIAYANLTSVSEITAAELALPSTYNLQPTDTVDVYVPGATIPAGGNAKYCPINAGEYNIWVSTAPNNFKITRLDDEGGNDYYSVEADPSNGTLTITGIVSSEWNTNTRFTLNDTATINGRNMVFGGDGDGPPGGGGGGGADPFVWPVHGNVYETPMKATSYRMLQGRKLIMNMSQRKMSQQEGEVVEHYYNKVVGEEAPKSLVTKGVYINKVFLKADGQTMDYDFDTGKGQMSSDYFTINQETKQKSDGKYLSSPIVKQIRVSFDHSIYGRMTATLNHYSNPQMKSGVTIKYNTHKSETKDLTGLLVREYKCKSMECRKLRKTKKLQGKLGNNKVLGYLNDKPKN